MHRFEVSQCCVCLRAFVAERCACCKSRDRFTFREQEALERNVRGDAEVKVWATTDKGVMHPCWAIRSGDTVRFMDAADTSERRVIRKSYSHSSQTATLTLDALPNHLTSIIEAIQAEQVGSGL